ncbi:MAG: outer membrane lipoprotein-sorting protein [Calditrichaceae bacterium]|nr:outer membrane lipoprotein-sorting protein [Calditrichaceae bacterium]
MFFRKVIITIIVLFSNQVFAQDISANEILKKIDANLSADNQVISSKMVIHGKRGDRTVESKSWTEGTEKSFTEYLAPARDKGTKMLKLGDQLWMYSPGTDRTIQISGHMLRQSVMGSDLSYEDMMEDDKLHEVYDAVIAGRDTLENTVCWILELTATEKDLAYPKRKLWADQKRFIPLREELYAKSGTLLKRIDFKDVRSIDGRWYPTRMIFKDVLKEGQGTEFIVDDITFNQDIPAYIFSKASLKK